MSKRWLPGKWLFWALIAVLAMAAITFAFRPDPVWVDLAEVSRGPLEVSITEEGKARVKDRYLISAPVSGYLHRIMLEVGDPVNAGQTLTEVDPMPSAILDARSRAEAEAKVEAARSALNSAQQKVEAAEAEARFARQELERLEALRSRSDNRFVSEEQIEQARATADRAQAILRSARFDREVMAHELAAARTRLEVSAARSNGEQPKERVAVTSPVAGAVLSVVRKSEGVIQSGSPIAEVGDPAALEVVIEVLSFDAVKLQPGMTVRFNGWGGPELEGVVRRVEPVGFEDVSALGVEEQRVQVVADITSPIEQWQSLGDGYRVDASFILWSASDVLWAPSSSIFSSEGQSWVFLARDDTVHRQVVQIGQSNGLKTVILDGLEVGDRVVRHPDRQLDEGVRIRAR
ncbi:MAG: HlyD family efflux transporter periplasmic adaptor subunit [Marinobacter sp.]|uniref:efflux RND transporter periplasmic adaptor subunit n=1 Tax=Marinobacter sp. TaxID=50741 RepID=UPI00396EC57C